MFAFAYCFLYDLQTDVESSPELLPIGTNDLGQVVGIIGSPPCAGLSEETGPGARVGRDLNDWIFPGSAWELANAIDISNTGRVVGYGRDPNGIGRALLLTPVDVDFDDDGDTDLADFKTLQTCMNGPGVRPMVECEARDLDRDGDIDLVDLFALQRLYTGSS